MRLVLSTMLATPDGDRPEYHHPFPLHVRAGLIDAQGAKLLALWSNRGWWSPTPSHALGTPTVSGIVAFAKVVDAMTRTAWRLWFSHLTARQLLELVPRPWKDGPEDLVAMCFSCGEVWATTTAVTVRVCPRCFAPPKTQDPDPLPVGELELQPPALELVVDNDCDDADGDDADDWTGEPSGGPCGEPGCELEAGHAGPHEADARPDADNDCDDD